MSSLAFGLASGLRRLGHEVVVIGRDHASPDPTKRRVEAVLGARGFTGPLLPVPSSVVRLLAGGFDVAHAFSPPDSLAALCWRRMRGGPAVLTWGEPVSREHLSDRRLRLALVSRATERSDLVIAPSEEVRFGLERWLMIEPVVVAPLDAGAHEALYRRFEGACGGRSG